MRRTPEKKCCIVHKLNRNKKDLSHWKHRIVTPFSDKSVSETGIKQGPDAYVIT